MLQEFKTPAGYFIVVDNEDFSCGVYRGQVDNITSDLVHATGLKVAGVVFLGDDVKPALASEGFVLLPVRSGSLSVPYWLSEPAGRGQEKKGIQISVRILTDQFPVYVRHFSDVRGFLREMGEKEKHIYSIAMMGAQVPRIDAMGVRVALPSARIFQARSRAAQTKAISKSQVRAADLVEQPGMEFVSRNPVYMARVLLRRMDFSGMERIPSDFDLNAQDVEFIQAFLSIMLKNEAKSDELSRHQARIAELISFFRIVDSILRRDQLTTGAELAGLPTGIGEKLLPFLEKRRRQSESKEEEIALWELEYRIKGQTGR